MAEDRLPRLYPKWEEQAGLLERYWDEVLRRIEAIEKKLDDYISTHP